MTATAPLAAPGPAPGAAGTPGRGRLRRLGPAVGLLPFLVYVTIFLLTPTITVAVGAFQSSDGAFSTEKVAALFDETPMRALRESLLLSASSAAIGAVLGALLAYLIVTAPPTSLLRRVVTAVCGVLAQFGGVTLAFAWMATLGFGGLLTDLLADVFGLGDTGTGWLYELPGLILVYTYFQIPLMVIVFLPALEGVRPQWREAAVNLGATTRQYWTKVAFPLLRPAFLGSALLLFANAFAAYATAAALVSQGAPITPLLIRAALTSEVVLGQAVLGLTVAIAAGLVATLSGAPAPVWAGGEDAPAGGAEADAGTGSGRLKRAMGVAADDVFEIGPYLGLGAPLAGTLRVLVPVEALTTAGGAGPAAAAGARQAAAFVLSVSSPFAAPLSMAFSGSLTTAALLAFLVSGAVADAKTTLMLGTVFRWKGVDAVVALLGGLTFLGSVLAGLAGGAGG